MFRVVLSIQAGKISSDILLRKLGNYSRKNRLYRAFRELGRVVRTVFLLKFISNAELRQQITAATNKVEAYHGLVKMNRCSYFEGRLLQNFTTWRILHVSPLYAILAGAALLSYVDTPDGDQASRAIYESVFESLYDGCATPDLGGRMTTSDFTDEVIRRVKSKLEAWAVLGSK